MLLLYDAITSVYTYVHLITYSYVDMCVEHTNQVRSCDHPKNVAFADSYIIDHSFVYVCIS